MSTRYRRHDQGDGMDPMIHLFLLLVFIVGVVLALPGLLLGIVLQRILRGHTWNLLLWLLLSLASAGLLFHLSYHGLGALITMALKDYVFTIKEHQAQIEQWNLRHLWSQTWPVWIRTLPLSPLVAFWREVQEGLRSGKDTSRTLLQQGQLQARRVARTKRAAKRRTRYPARIPDAVKGLMVMGVPLEEEAE